MKQFSVMLIILAMAAFAAGPALAKGGHHSGGHHSSGHSSGHAHASKPAHKSNSGHANHAAKAPKPNNAMKSQPKATKSQPKTVKSQPKAATKTVESRPTTMKAQPNVHQQAKTATAPHHVPHHVSKTVSAVHNGASAQTTPKTNSTTAATTPTTTKATTTSHATRATTVSHRGSNYHRGYGRRNYNRNRRNYARNGRPSFAVGPNQVVGAGSGPQTVAPWATRIRAGSGRQGQGQGGLQFQVTNNSNPALFSAPPSVSPTGTLNFTPAAAQAGTATVTLVLRSGIATSVPRTFHITVR